MGRFSAFVLAAGYGTRLRPLTDEIPKPLLPVGDQPLLVSTLRALHEAGAAELWVNVHHKHDQIINVLNTLPFKVQVNYEPRILGTAGGLAAVRERVEPPIVVVNGDIVTVLPIRSLLAGSGAALTLAVAAPRTDGGAPGVGTVGLDEQGQVVRLRGERFGREVRGADYVGVASVHAECLESLPSEGCLIGDWALPWLRRGGSIATVHSPAPFRDLGDPKSYLEVNLDWLGEESHFGADVVRPPGITFERSLIGAGARLRGQGLVRESLVLPGAVAEAPLERSIVLPSGRVVPVT